MSKALPLLINRTIFFAFTLLFFGCAKEKEDEIAEAIDTANIFLSSRICGSAIAVLEGIGRQNDNARYLQTLSSAYACKSDYDEVTFFGTNLPNLVDVGPPVEPFGGVTTWNTSISMDSASDKGYSNLWTAINILLYAGGIPADIDHRALH